MRVPLVYQFPNFCHLTMYSNISTSRHTTLLLRHEASIDNYEHEAPSLTPTRHKYFACHIWLSPEITVRALSMTVNALAPILSSPRSSTLRFHALLRPFVRGTNRKKQINRCPWLPTRYVVPLPPPPLSCMPRITRARRAQAKISRALANLTTPQNTKQTQNSSAGTDVHLERERIVNDAGPDVPLVTVAEYLEHWLPKTPLLEVTVLDIIDKVTHSKAYARGRWTAFPRDPANVRHGHEDDIYASLAQVVSAVQEAAIRCAPGIEPTTCFVTNPKKPPVAVERDAHRTRPDAYFVYKDPHRYSPHKPVHWLDIIATGEFKRHENYRDTQDVSVSFRLSSFGI